MPDDEPREVCNRGKHVATRRLRPQQVTHDCSVVCARVSFLNQCEFWEHERGFEMLNLTRAKVGGLRVARKDAKLHPHFASGTTGAPSAVAHNLFSRVRKRPKLAENVRVMNKLLYGADYDDADDEALESVLRKVDVGPYPSQTNSLSYAQCVQAVQLGQLPDGTLLQPQLRAHRGRALIVSTTCAAGATEVVQLCGSLKLLTIAHMSPIGAPAAGHYLTAAAARLFATAQEPFELTLVEVQQALMEPGLIETLNAMVNRNEGDAFSHEDMVNLLTADAPEDCGVEHPWLRDTPGQRIKLPEDVIPASSFDMCLRASMRTYVDGPPQLHVQMVQSGAQYFACIWQLSLAFLNELRNAARSGAAATAAVLPVANAYAGEAPAPAPPLVTAHEQALAAVAAVRGLRGPR